jgi:hypothetical protein
MSPRSAIILVSVVGIFTVASAASARSLDTSARPPSLVVAAVSPAREETGVAVFDVRLSHTSARRVSVRYATANGSARSGADYSARTGVLVFRGGQKSKRVRVPALDDAEPEPNETFFLRVSAARGASVRISRATGVILANDLPAPFRLRAELTGSEQLPGPGSPNAHGTAIVDFEPVRELASFTVSVTGVEQPSDAGIGRGRRGDPPTGGVLLFTDRFPAGGTLTDSKRLALITILELYREPEAFFVEVRSASGLGSGGIRGQLVRVP